MKRNKQKIQLDLRKERVRSRITGSEGRPRLTVFRSSKHIYAQVINDHAGKTLAAASTLDPVFKEKKIKTATIAAAKLVGGMIAEKAIKAGVKKVVFDRGGNIYHGRIKILAESAREKGLEF